MFEVMFNVLITVIKCNGMFLLSQNVPHLSTDSVRCSEYQWSETLGETRTVNNLYDTYLFYFCSTRQGQRKEILSLCYRVQTGFGAHASSHPKGTRGSFLGPVADHALQCSIKVKNAWSSTSSPPYVFMAWYLIKQWFRLHCRVSV
jgi:hypothetical protein